MSTMRPRYGLLIGAFLLALPGCSAAASCSKDEAIAAEAEAVALKDWEEIHASYVRFRHCDDGAIAEGYSESITRLLTDRWETLPRLQSLTSRDKNFEAFVIRHLDQTMSRNRYEIILHNARNRCPVGASAMCATLIEQLKRL